MAEGLRTVRRCRGLRCRREPSTPPSAPPSSSATGERGGEKSTRGRGDGKEEVRAGLRSSAFAFSSEAAGWWGR